MYWGNRSKLLISNRAMILAVPSWVWASFACYIAAHAKRVQASRPKGYLLSRLSRDKANPARMWWMWIWTTALFESSWPLSCYPTLQYSTGILKFCLNWGIDFASYRVKMFQQFIITTSASRTISHRSKAHTGYTWCSTYQCSAVLQGSTAADLAGIRY